MIDLLKKLTKEQRDNTHIETPPRYLMFSVKDEKAQAFNLPFLQTNVDLAIRTLASSVTNPDSVVSKYPQDFTLYKLGTFDEITGAIVTLERPEYIIRADELLIAIQKQNAMNLKKEPEKNADQTVQS